MLAAGMEHGDPARFCGDVDVRVARGLLFNSNRTKLYSSKQR